MRKILYTMIAMAPTMALAGGLFPAQPVPMEPGYGAEGAGTHFAVPVGRPGLDCVVNPVSMTHRNVTVVTENTYVEKDVISFPANVLFDFDKDFVRPEGLEVLGAFLAELLESRIEAINIVGHTDIKGSWAYNKDLGQRRADSVAAVLLDLGFNPDGITTDSGSFDFPVAPNTNPDGSDNPEGRQLNRRVDVEVTRVVERVEADESVVRVGRNPQVFHRLSDDNTVYCGGDEIPTRNINVNPGQNPGRGTIFNPGRWGVGY